MTKSILSLSLKAIITFAVIQGGLISAQTVQTNNIFGEKYEELAHHLQSGLIQAQKQVGASDADFQTFERFNEKRINDESGYLYTQIREGKINKSNVNEYEQAIVKKYTAFYSDFLKARVEYPSSVVEYTHPVYPRILTANCDSACINPDFSTGNLNGWTAGYGRNSSLSQSFFNITGIVMSPCGPVTQAAQDPMTSNSWQVTIQNPGSDPIVPSIPTVSPFSISGYSARVGDGTGINYGVGILQETFMVTPASENFTYQYAVVLQNPVGHPYFNQPFFQAVVLDSNNDTIPQCGKYLVTSGYQTGGKGWDSTTYNGEKLYYRNWTSVFTPLKNYVGQCVTVRFTTGDCAQGGHFGYAYVTASCSPIGLISSSPAFCGQSTITLTAPPGGDAYKWTGPWVTAIVGSDSGQSVTIDSSGTYTVVVSPVTGAACNDTLVINVPKAPGPIPIPDFHADTVCQGQKTAFINTSNPLVGPNVKFYWDFYNIGSYQDSTTNPLWQYTLPGVYTVKLHELNNGCGADTLIQVKVDSTVAGAFTNTTACAKQTVFFTNLTNGASNYFWDFGDPSSGNADTTSSPSPSHVYDTAGTYIVTLIAKNGGPCPDTLKQSVTVLAPPVITVSGPDSVCKGSSILLNATAPGASTWSWAPPASVACPTCNSTQVSPTVTTTYTITANNGTCSGDTTFTVYVKPIPVISITVVPSSDTICLGDSALLKASGGCSYLWTANANTADSEYVKPVVAGNDQVFLQASCNGCSVGANKIIVVLSPSSFNITLSKDSICPGDSSTITASGGTNYKWLNPSSTNSTITVKTSNTYSVVVFSPCGNDTLTKTLHVSSVPIVGISGDSAICMGSNANFVATGGGKYTWSTGATTSGITVTNPTIGLHTYTVTVSNGHCSSDTTITLRVNAFPNHKVTAAPPDICVGTCTVLTDTGTGGSYLWSTGATTSSITVCPTSTTSYTCIRYNGCKDSAKQVVTVDVPPLNVCCDVTIKIDSSAQLIALGSPSNSYVWEPPTGLSCTTCPDPFASPTVTTTYTVTATDSAGCRISRTVTVTLECSDFFVPNVFTPNNDGVNDDFVISMPNFATYSIMIYDRWGKLVYKSSDPRTYWNGRIMGTNNLVPDGVYYYVIDATCGTDNTYKHKGFVQVVGEKK